MDNHTQAHAPARRRRLAVGAAIIAAGVLVLPRFAGGAADSEASYTGCLRTSGNNKGTLVAVKQGNSPTRACTANEQQIHVSGGDITSVSAGTGISLQNAGGLGLVDTQGDARVGLDPKYQLPQNCLTGDLVFARPHSTGNKWGCATAPKALPRTVVAHRIAPNGSQYIGAPGINLGSVNLGSQPSAWVFNVRIDAEKDRDSDIDDMILDCDLWVTGQSKALDTSSLFQDAATSTYYGRTNLTLAGAAYLPANANARVFCGDGGRDMRWKSFVLTAIPVDDLNPQ